MWWLCKLLQNLKVNGNFDLAKFYPKTYCLQVECSKFDRTTILCFVVNAEYPIFVMPTFPESGDYKADIYGEKLKST